MPLSDFAKFDPRTSAAQHDVIQKLTSLILVAMEFRLILLRTAIKFHR